MNLLRQTPWCCSSWVLIHVSALRLMNTWVEPRDVNCKSVVWKKLKWHQQELEQHLLGSEFFSLLLVLFCSTLLEPWNWCSLVPVPGDDSWRFWPQDFLISLPVSIRFWRGCASTTYCTDCACTGPWQMATTETFTPSFSSHYTCCGCRSWQSDVLKLKKSTWSLGTIGSIGTIDQ